MKIVLGYYLFARRTGGANSPFGGPTEAKFLEMLIEALMLLQNLSLFKFLEMLIKLVILNPCLL